MKYSEEITNQLNNLLNRTYDAEKGYQLAQDSVSDFEIKKFLGDQIQRRYHFRHALKNEVLKYGELKSNQGSLKGDIHRTWMKLSTILTGDEIENFLEEIQRGEEDCVEDYNDFLEKFALVLPPSTYELITKQRDSIQANIYEVKKFEELVS